MSPKQPRVQPDAADPLRYEARILAGRHAGVRTATTREQELAGGLVGSLEIIIDGLTALIAQFKSDGPSGLLLSDGCAIRGVARCSHRQRHLRPGWRRHHSHEACCRWPD